MVFGRELQRLTGGVEQIEVEARDVRELYAALEGRFPGIRAHLEREMAVAIDGQVYRDALLEPVAPESEVHFLPALAGG